MTGSKEAPTDREVKPNLITHGESHIISIRNTNVSLDNS